MLDVEALSEMMAGIVADEIHKAVAPLKAQIAELEARDPVAGPPGEKGEPGERGENGADGKDGADGRGVRNLLIDRDGELVATMDDGTVKSLGPVIGKDGADGTDGAPGKDGRDGIDLDSFDAIVTDDDRTVELKFVSGETERVASFKWPVMMDRGVYKAGDTYDAGDAVSWGGSVWVAQKQTDAKPDTAESGWRLAVKRGRDGKDAK
jgi:hypothetical protein